MNPPPHELRLNEGNEMEIQSDYQAQIFFDLLFGDAI